MRSLHNSGVPGLSGQFFRQFALTISVSMLISATNAMTMTPARAAWVFGHRQADAHGHAGKEALPWWFFALIGGLAAFGPVGLLVGPLAVALFLALLRIYERDYLNPPPAAPSG